jgi:hypothetical protein
LRLAALILLSAPWLWAQFAKVDASTPEGQAFVCLYQFDFPGAHAILDREIARNPSSPAPYSVKAAALFFYELDRLKILQTQFFEDDDKLADRRKLTPDPLLREQFFRLLDATRRHASSRLAAHPEDREALFAQAMASGLETDYAALVERRRLGSFSLAKQSQAHALKLLSLNPPYYDAHLTTGSVEYVVSSLPFFLRWFVRIDQVEGSKQRAVEHLKIVAERGRYYGPFARVLLSVIALREKRPWEAEFLLSGLCADFPANPLFRRELDRARNLVRLRAPSATTGDGAGR